MIDSLVGGNISYKMFDMPEKRDRYEEEIEDLLSGADDLPSRPREDSPLSEEVATFLRGSFVPLLRYFSSGRLFVCATILAGLFIILKSPIIALAGLVFFVAGYLSYLLHGRSEDNFLTKFLRSFKK